MKNFTRPFTWVIAALVLGTTFGFLLAARRAAPVGETPRILKQRIAKLQREISHLKQGGGADPRVAGTRPESAPPGDLEPGSNGVGPTRVKPKKTSPTLEEVLAWIRSDNRKSWWRALDVVRKMKDRQKKLELLKELLAKSDSRLVERSARYIDDIGGPEAVALAVDLLKGHQSSDVRRQAARELGDLGGGYAHSALMESFRTDGNFRVRMTSAIELRRLGDTGPRDALVLELSQQVDNVDGAVREDMIERMGHLRGEVTLPFLARALSDTNSDVRRKAIDSLEDTGLATAIPFLQAAVQDPNPDVARRAQSAIQEIEEDLAKNARND